MLQNCGLKLLDFSGRGNELKKGLRIRNVYGIIYWFVVIFRVRIDFRKTVVGD